MKKFSMSIIIVFLLMNCVKKEEITLYIDGGPVINRTHHFPIDTLGTYDSTLTLQIFSDPIWNSITVKLNNEILSDPAIEGNSISFTKSISTQDVEYALEIESDLGSANAVCSMPGSFKIPKPPELWITPGEDCEVSWEQAANAQWYEIDISCWDTLYPHENTWDTTILLIDTSTIIIMGSKINFYGTMSVLITAGNGASLLPGDEGNIEGNGKGYWVAESKTHRSIKIGWW